MKKWTLVFVLFFSYNLLSDSKQILREKNTNEDEAETYLNDVNNNLLREMNKLVEAQWNYNTDLSDENGQIALQAQADFDKFQKEQSVKTLEFDWTNFKDDNKRQFNKLALLGIAALSEEDGKTFATVSNEMESIYNKAKISLNGQNCGNDCALEPDLTQILANSNEYNLLEDVWTKWRDATGKLMRENYIKYYELGNKAAKLNDIPGIGKLDTFDDIWLYPWETPDLKQQSEKLWGEIKPFYEKLHAYVRMRLRIVYGDKMPKDGTLPAHLLGNMWAQSWSNILNLPGVDPFPEVQTIDVTQAMVDQKYDAKKMFDLSDVFFKELGLYEMTQKFWDKSVIVKAPNKDMVCHASAWDFYADSAGKDDFRIKQCTDITMSDLVTVHHEMGHIEYFMQYKEQRVVFREGANPGFHEAIGDLLALSVSTPKHLKKIGLLADKPDEDEDTKNKVNIKFQLKMALDKLAFLPFGYIMDLWRWDVFSEKTKKEDLNRHWWELRLQYQGVSPPNKRNEKDFDPGAKFHIPASVEYIRYFVSHILQFQFHEKLCSIADPGSPLHECDIDGNKDAGNLLAAMLKKGSSVPWQDQLNDFVGTKDMSFGALLKYFEPLQKFLDEQLKDEKPGWTSNVDDYMGERSGSISTRISILFFIISLMVAFLI